MKSQKKVTVKEKFMASHEIINRILWDNRLNPKAFVIGFQDRMSKSGLREKPLLEWGEESEIPWHRIRYIRCGETWVWDREQRIDLFATDNLPVTAWQTTTEVVPTAKTLVPFQPKTVYQWNGKSWAPVTQMPETREPEQLSIVSYNVLTNRYSNTETHLPQRIPVILDQLYQCQAPIICLQEVTTVLLEQLLAQPWLQNWYISDTPATLDEVKGLLLVSQYPFSLIEHAFSSQKNCLVGSFLLGKQTVHVGVVHLTSNRAENAVQIRQKQLQQVADYLQYLPGTSFIVGDFNMREKVILSSSWMDCWEKLHPNEPGYTFDPRINSLAALHTLTGEPGRLDRILMHDASQHWLAETLHLFGNQPLDTETGKLFPSDHFGICLRLLSKKTDSQLQTLLPTYQSALVVIPPTHYWAPIQAIRQKYDSKVNRWMPHITLVYGFIPDTHFGEAAQQIAESVKSLKPFEVTLSGFGTFEHRNSTTVWVKPESKQVDAWQTLQQSIQRLFPQCQEQSSRATGFTPHLSVGQFVDKPTADKSLPVWQPVDFKVTKIALISRKGDEPFTVRYWVELGTGTIEMATTTNVIDFVKHHFTEITTSQYEHQQMVLALVKQACDDALGQAGSLHLLGSARLGLQTSKSDIDAIYLIPKGLNQAVFLQSVKEQLEGIYQMARLVTDVQVPALRLVIEGQSVDLLCANSPFFPAGLEVITADKASLFDTQSWQALSGCLEADCIIQVAQDTVGMDDFRWLVRAVRLWARNRKITGNGWGYLGSFSWTLLVAWSCQIVSKKNAKPAREELLKHFFDTLSKHDWNVPISLTEAGKQYSIRSKRDWMPIVTSVKPYFNSARNVTQSMFRILKEELKRANKLTLTDWQQVFEEQSIATTHCLQLQLTCVTEEDLQECCGWMEGNLVGLLIDLEKANLTIRPYPGFVMEATEAKLFVGWNLTDLTEQNIHYKPVHEFINRFETWAQRPAHSQLAYAAL